MRLALWRAHTRATAHRHGSGDLTEAASPRAASPRAASRGAASRGAASRGAATGRRPAVRKRLAAVVSGLAGTALLAPALVAAPAQAGLLDDVGGLVPGGDSLDPSGLLPDLGSPLDPNGSPLNPGDPLSLTAPTPVIAPGGAGSIEFLGQVVCTSDGTVQKTCAALPLDQLGSVASLLLTAVPADPDDIPEWDPSTCPGAIGAVCSIPLTSLVGSTPLAPAVEFVPGLPGGGVAEAPDTRITSAEPDGESTSHTFRFEAVDGDGQQLEDAAFECTLQFTRKGATASQEQPRWAGCGTGPAASKTYDDLAAGDYVFGVRAVLGTGEEALRDQSPATQQWTVTVAEGPQGPQTRITSGPRNNAWVLTDKVTFRFRSEPAAERFDCSLNGRLQGTACDDGEWTKRRLPRGTHVFKVTALADEMWDYTPATRTFQVPVDDRALAATWQWTRTTMKKHFKNTVSITRAKGATLTTKSPQRFRRVVLVADKGRGFGTVRVLLGNRVLGEVNLHAKRLRQRAVIPVKTFTGKIRSGKLRVVVVSSGRTVRIDGLGVARR